jgi:hypothetical protein
VTDFAPQTTSDQAVIAGGDLRSIAFRPAEPGRVSVRSIPADPGAHSESGLVGGLDLRRPGRAQPLASMQAPSGTGTVLALSYTATAADLSTAGSWTCDVANATDVDMGFDTEITYPSSTPVPPVVVQRPPVTFDVELLNLILGEAIRDAGLSWHLESSPDLSESVVRWSGALGASLPDPLKGATSYRFNVPDFRAENDTGIGTITWAVVRILNFDSDPYAPVTGVFTERNAVPTLHIDIAFAANTASAVVIDSDVDLDKVDVEVAVNSLSVGVDVGFDGTVQATVTGSVGVKVDGVDVYDISEQTSVTLQDAINSGWFGNFQPPPVRQYTDQFFIALMRLGAQARIESYQTKGQTLTVTYTVPAVVPPPTPVVPPVVPRPTPVIPGVVPRAAPNRGEGS